MKKRISIVLILVIHILTPVHLAQAQKQASIPRIGVLLLGAPPNVKVETGDFIEASDLSVVNDAGMAGNSIPEGRVKC